MSALFPEPLRGPRALPAARGGRLKVLGIALAPLGSLRDAVAHAGGLSIDIHEDPKSAFDAVLGASFDVIAVFARGDDDAPVLARIAAWGAAPIVAVVPEGCVARPFFSSGADDVLSRTDPPALIARAFENAAERDYARRIRTAAASAPARILLAQEAAEGLIILDTEGRVQFASPEAERILGATPGTMAGQPFGHPVITGEAQRIETGGAPAEVRFIETEWGGVPARLGSVADVSVRRALERAREEAQAARGAAFDDVTRTLSPALRTELTTILGFSELMLAEPFGPLGHARYRGYLSDIADSARTILKEAERIGAAAPAAPNADAVLH